MSTIDKVKNALHLNKDHSTTSTGTHTTTGATTHNNGVPEGTAGPHSSRVANAADPRIDSDLDSTRRTGAVGTGVGTGNSGYTGTGTGVTGTSGSTTTAGPHSSHLANKVDPRVDSDLDGSRNLGAASGNTGASAYSGNTANSGYTGTHAGTHTGTGVTGTTGTHGGISNSTNAGPHDSNLANKVDPRVDSDLDGKGNRHGIHAHGLTGVSGSHATPGSGTAQNTAGPHNSDLANKLDPRVDADLDGSKTYGGNKTHA